MNSHPKSPQKITNDSSSGSFVLLRTDRLANLAADCNDEIANALRALADSSPIDFTIENAIELCEKVIRILEPPNIDLNSQDEKSPSKSEREADAYDDYFPVTRVDGDARHVFAWSLVSAFHELLIEAKTGSSLTPVEWTVIRQGFVELAMLITNYDDRYCEE